MKSTAINIVLCVAASSAAMLRAEENTMPYNTNPTLPFTIKVTEEPFENRPDYMSKNNPSWGMDFPYSPVMIDGEFWVITKNGYQNPVYRYKGTNIENAVRQPDGKLIADTFPSAPDAPAYYILGGMWYDASDKKLYAPLHVELHGLVNPILREIHLASSDDKGLTWKYEGPIITDNAPGAPRRSQKDFKGPIYSGGAGDHVIYADERNGFVYIFASQYTWGGGTGLLRHTVARCAIADKMVPGKWRKFYEGAWNEPGLGGKASYVNGYVVTYNTYLKKYLSFNYVSGISYCTDLSKQDWSPSFYLGGKYWGVKDLYATWPTNAEKNDISNSGDNFYVYGSWWTAGKRFRVALGRGETKPACEFTQPSIFLSSATTGIEAISANPGHLYNLETFPESSDPIEARQTRIVGCGDPEVKYAGAWSDQADKSYYKGLAKTSNEKGASVEFPFKGKDIYWRAVAGPDQGQADVYLDGKWQGTADCWASERLIWQFAFIKRGLSGEGPHTIKVVAKNEKNPRSTGCAITHMLFEEPTK